MQYDHSEKPGGSFDFSLGDYGAECADSAIIAYSQRNDLYIL